MWSLIKVEGSKSSDGAVPQWQVINSISLYTQAVCALFSSIVAEVAACKVWIDGPSTAAPAIAAPPLRDPAALDAHLNRRLFDAERKVRASRYYRTRPKCT